MHCQPIEPVIAGMDGHIGQCSGSGARGRCGHRPGHPHTHRHGRMSGGGGARLAALRWPPNRPVWTDRVPVTGRRYPYARHAARHRRCRRGPKVGLRVVVAGEADPVAKQPARLPHPARISPIVGQGPSAAPRRPMDLAIRPVPVRAKSRAHSMTQHRTDGPDRQAPRPGWRRGPPTHGWWDLRRGMHDGCPVAVVSDTDRAA